MRWVPVNAAPGAAEILPSDSIHRRTLKAHCLECVDPTRAPIGGLTGFPSEKLLDLAGEVFPAIGCRRRLPYGQ
jgi:hypothetical protein